MAGIVAWAGFSIRRNTDTVFFLFLSCDGMFYLDPQMCLRPTFLKCLRLCLSCKMRNV